MWKLLKRTKQESLSLFSWQPQHVYVVFRGERRLKLMLPRNPRNCNIFISPDRKMGWIGVNRSIHWYNCLLSLRGVIADWPPSSVLSASWCGSRAITIRRCSTIFCRGNGEKVTLTSHAYVSHFKNTEAEKPDHYHKYVYITYYTIFQSIASCFFSFTFLNIQNFHQMRFKASWYKRFSLDHRIKLI